MCQALEEEVEEIQRAGGGRRISVSGGRLVGRAGHQFVYVFSLDQQVTIPDDAPGQLELEASRDKSVTYGCQVLACLGFEITLACPVSLPGDLGWATLLLDPSFLLEKLAERLSSLRPDQSLLSLELFGLRGEGRKVASAPPSIEVPDANAFQLEAVQAAIERTITYVWGPPGTGKTTALACITEALVNRGLRVLVAASTNVAVDNAILKIAERLGATGQVVRFGTPQVAALRDEPMLQLEGIAAARGGDLLLERATLRQQRRALEGNLPDKGDEESDGGQLPLFWRLPGANGLAETIHRAGADPSIQPVDEQDVQRIEEQERALTRKLEALQEQALREARVVGATLSRCFLAANLSEQGFDAVLIDEASAAPLPAAFFAASMARQKVVALGDPKQLPPIAMSASPTVARWLRRDLFQQAALTDDDERAVLLREQYRMHPDISRLTNQLVYGGRLIDAVTERRHRGASATRLVDTSDRPGSCERPAGGSRFNRTHAQMAVELALELLGGWEGLEQASIAIVTPYAAQAKLIWRLLREDGIGHLVDVGTVHRFQGLERETIIFDTVEAPPLMPARFVSGGYDSEAMRLINVAITRARSRLIVLANTRHLGRTLHRQSVMRGLLGMLQE